MTRRIVMGGILAIAAALSLFWLFATMVGHMMEPSGGGIGGALAACAIGVGAIAVAALVLLVRGRLNAIVLAAAVALMGVLAFIPEAIYSAGRAAGALSERAEKRALEASVVAELESRKQDIEARAAAKRPYTPEQSLDFLFFVTRSDLSNRLMRDYSDISLGLLRRALQDKVIDPNGWVQGREFVDMVPEPLFLHYYKFWARTMRRGPVDRLRWTIMRTLAENGADLTMPAAAWLVEDLAKPERPGVTKDWINLD